MAAFPPPTLNLVIENPLWGLLASCAWHTRGQRTVPLELFQPDAESIHGWMRVLSDGTISTTLRQFESLLRDIHRHRGRVVFADIQGRWTTPHDWLAYFADWRREVAVAVSHVPGFFDPNWLTEPVIGLRNGIVVERAFDRLPILADALEEAGCDHPLILAHLREPYDHAHHCWAVDLLTFGGRPLAGG